MKLLPIALALLALASSKAGAQTLPSPALANGAITAPMLASGAAALNLGWVGTTANVEGTGVQGIDGQPFFIYQAPSTPTQAAQAALRVQRNATYTGGYSGGTVKTIWAYATTSPNGLFYEWPITGEMHNQTDSSMNAQNVAVNGTAFKEFNAGHVYASGEVGATWGGNFACNDNTGAVSPHNSCIGAEIDNAFLAGAGADPHRQRVVLQLAWGTTGGVAASLNDHIGTGILMGFNSTTTMDNAIFLSGANGGVYNIGINFAGGSFSTAPLYLGIGQKIIFDGTTDALGNMNGYNWALSDIFGTMAFTFGGRNTFTIDPSGNAFAAGNISTASTITGGNVTALSTVSAPTITGTTVTGTTVNAGSLGFGGTWVLSNITGTMAFTFGGSLAFTIDQSGDAYAAGNINTASTITGGSIASLSSVKLGNTTIAALPVCNSAALGQEIYVTNAAQTLAANIGAIVSGTGSNSIRVGCDGTNWRVGG